MHRNEFMQEVSGIGCDHRVIDLANIVNEFTGNGAGVKYVERRDWDVKTRLLSSIEKAKRVLDYKPQMEFVEGLKKVHEWFIDNRENIKKSVEF